MKKALWGVLLATVPLAGQGPLSLEEAVRTAIEKHPAMEAVSAQAAAAGARIQQARSGYLPQVNYQESFARSDNPVYVFGSLLTQRQFTESNFAIGSLNRPDFLNNFQSLLAVEQTVFDAGQTRNNTRAAELGRDMVEQQQRAATMNVIAGVVRAYHGAVLAAESLKVAEEAVRSAEADLQRAETVRSAGMATDADVLSIRVHLAGMREQRIRRRYDLDVARSALNEALGLPLDTPHDLTTPLSALAPPAAQAAEYERKAAAERPELRQAELSARLAEVQSKTARAAYWPQVSLRGVFEADRQNFVNKGGANWYLGATMRWNLFGGFATQARVKEAEHALRGAQAERQRADAGVRLQVRRAHADLQAAQERIEVAGVAVDQAEESLRITRNRYEAGMTTVTDLLRNETALLEAKTRRLAAIYDQRVAAAMVELAAGVLSADSEVLK
ncbi:MAG: TolC family protein [Bryobacteraceae bacterium]|nr:TolC family protein [Bryobacteraceae bacterium]